MTDTTVRPRRVLRVVLVSLAVLAAGGAAVGAIGYCSVFGCTFFSEDFEPQGEKAREARAKAVQRSAALADRASTGARVLATATADGCRTGQNDWKRKDTYSHECEVLASRLVVLTTDRTRVADALTDADAVFREDLGCRVTPGGGGLDRVRDEYWRDDNPNVLREGAAGLPSVTYLCGGDVHVDVDPSSAQASGARLGDLGSGLLGHDDDLAQDWYTVEDVRALRESDAELALVITVHDPYYRTRF